MLNDDIISPPHEEIHHYIKNRAAKTIQNFYRSYIKTDRDKATGLPLDPITGDPIDKGNIVRIIYESYNSNTKAPIRRLQCYDINTLWESFKYNKNNIALNPIVNTKFPRSQFKQILNKAIEVGLISKDSKEKYLKQYGYEKSSNYTDPNSTSIYEINANKDKALFKDLYKTRMGMLLCYYALKNEYDILEKLVYISLEHDYGLSASSDFQTINYVKKVGDALPKFPPNTLSVLKKQIKQHGMNPIYDNTLIIDTAIEKPLLDNGIDYYTVLNACAFNQNSQSLLFIMQFSPYLYNPYQKIADLGVSPLHMILINDIVDVEIIDVVRAYYTEQDLERKSCVGSIMELAITKLEIQPEIMTKLFC
jgi:hypothetical protein